MALLKLSGIIDKISGKIGGSILGTSSNGSYIKSNSYSQQHPTISQQKQRNKIFIVPQVWRKLSSQEKENWNKETSLYPYKNRVDDVVYYTGYQLFNKLNAGRLLIDASINDTVPIFEPIANATYLVALLSQFQFNISYSNAVIGTWLIVYSTKPLNGNVIPVYSDYKKIQAFRMNLSAQSFSITNQYANVYGSRPQGLYIWSKFKTVVDASGHMSEFTNSIKTVVS